MLALELIEKLRDLSPQAANVALNVGIPRIIPLAAGLGLTVEEVGRNRVVTSLPLRRRTRNHVGSIYFGAQMTQAEITMGLLLFHQYPPGHWSMQVKRVEADFLARGRSRLRAICAPANDALATLDQARTNDEGRAEAWLPVEVADEGGEKVAEMRFLAAIQRISAPR